MSFRRRLSLSIVLLALGLVVLVSTVYLRYLLRMQLQFALRQAELVAEQVQSATLESVRQQTEAQKFVSSGLAESREFWRRVVEEDAQLSEVLETALGSFDTIAEIAVTDEKGQMLLDTMGRQQWVNRAPLTDLAGRGFVAGLRAVYTPQRDYEVSRALGYEGQVVLVAHVVVSSALLRKQLDPQIRRLGAGAGLCMLVSLALAVAFSRIVFRPLDGLGKALERMTRGEFSASAPVSGAGGEEYQAITSKLSLLGQPIRDAWEGVSSLRGNVEQLMRKLEDAVLLFDGDDRLIIASAAAEAFLGRKRREIMGEKLAEIFPPETELGALVESAVRLRQPIEERLVPLSPDLEQAPRRPAQALLSVELMEDFSTHRSQGVLVVLRDAETRNQIHTQVEVCNRLTAISRLTGGVAHEIKNPLNAIALHLELLKNRVQAAEGQTPPELEVILRELARLDRVVKTFLDFTRPVDLRLSDVALPGLVEEIAALAGPEALARQVRIRVEDGSSGARINADRDLLKQAVLNLAVNGIQAMPQGGELGLAVTREGPQVELSVSDQGEGIAPEIRDKIFRLYFTTKEKGSGIGLAMTFRIVQLHNGTIDFSSEKGRGTTFRIRFPSMEAR